MKKVNARKFIKCIEYLQILNDTDINKLDLSEFTEPLKVKRDEFLSAGLTNKDYLVRCCKPKKIVYETTMKNFVQKNKKTDIEYRGRGGFC